MTRVVLVTGGTRGLGLGIAQAFFAAGDRVVVCGRNAHDGPGRFVECDVREPAEVDALIASIMATEGQLDVVVNNAGGSPSALVSSSSPRFAERIIALNLLGPLYVARAARAAMTSGVILNIGSVAAVRPAPGTAAYAAAKAGLTVLTRALALEWAPDVRVNQVRPVGDGEQRAHLWRWRGGVGHRSDGSDGQARGRCCGLCDALVSGARLCDGRRFVR